MKLFRTMTYYFWILGILLLSLACIPEESVENDLDQRVLSEWKRHEEIVEGVIEGTLPEQAIPLEDFQRSCLFFQELTGINARIDFPYVGGAVSTADTPEDLKRWRAWFQQNKHRLYWDERSSTVKTHAQ